MKRLICIYMFLLSFGFSINVTSGGTVSNNQLSIDIKHYDIRLKVDTKRQRLELYTVANKHGAPFTQIIDCCCNGVSRPLR